MRHVTLRQLRTFAEVLRCGSFAAAAQALHLTPPAVTLQMRQLESRAGLPLMERSGSRIEATEAGREVASAAQRIDLAISDCADALSALRGLKGGRVSIGVVSTAKYFAPHALSAFAQAFPSVEIRLEVGNRSTIVGALEANTLDLALTGRPPEHLEVDRAPIGAHPHVVVARADHPHARHKKLPASVLADETFLVREPGSGTRNLMERFFAEARVAPHIGMEMASNETIKQAVMAGLGIAFLSAHTVSAELADGRLVMLDVAGLPVVRQWFIVKLARRRLLPAAQALRQFLIDEGEKFLPPMPQNVPARRQRAARRPMGGRRKRARSSSKVQR
jgi:LysR family transcriptional regulator, low CO2-responsive transcriptional regulator